MTKKYHLILALLFISRLSFAGDPVEIKSIQAVRIALPPRLDGNLDDACWQTAPIGSDFITNSPVFGKVPRQRTEVRILYDNYAIYFGIYCYDTDPQNIARSLSERDGNANTDDIAIGLDTYDDNQNAFRFTVSAAGVQSDGKMSQYNYDTNWDAVWESKTSIRSDGWVAEVRIPYSALRFAKKDVQSWGLQVARTDKYDGEFSTWSPVDPKIAGAINQWGALTGLEKIEPPLRLSLSPYISAGFQSEPISMNPVTYARRTSINGGLDLKYGINESFTLDMTLIPDFGQVQSDNTVLNLGPFEVYYDERRPFFTEGTELFNKSDLFYSRRIGATPSLYYAVPYMIDENERILSNPSVSQLYNATKLSGRTKKGLGIGVFNAVTAPMYAEIKNDSSGETRKIMTEPLANYNIVVFDQTLKNNSNIGFINTNVMRDGNWTDANVSAFDFNIKDKSNTYSLNGDAKMSMRWNQKFEDVVGGNPQTGHAYHLNFSKISGNFQFDLMNGIIDKRFNKNDLGIQFQNNELSNFVGVKYYWFDPKGKFLYKDFYFGSNLTHRADSLQFINLEINSGFTFTFINFWNLFVGVNGKPFGINDYYEPRVPGRFYHQIEYGYAFVELYTDDRKKLLLDLMVAAAESPNPDDPYFEGKIAPRFRFSDKFMIEAEAYASKDNRNHGFVDIDNNGDIIFGERNITTVSNIIAPRFIFSPHSSISLRARHYWSKVEYFDFFVLNENGNLGTSDYDADADESFNAFNLDLIFNWEFAPGSHLVISWKNNILQADDKSYENYFSNVRKTMETPQTNGLSIKLIYYLDAARFLGKSG